METHSRLPVYICLALIVLLLGATGYGYVSLFKLQKAHSALQAETALTQSTVTEKENHILNLEAIIEMRSQELAVSEENGAELSRMLTEEKERNDSLEAQVNKISGTVGKLSKLSKIDPELLIKYSRVYFLNENYMPEKVVEVDEVFRSNPEEPEFIHAKVASRLDDLLQDAKSDGLDLRVTSGFRSFDEQMALKGTYTTNYGSGANAFSADQGYSEHQLGTTIDFTTTELGGGLVGFDQTEAYIWLQKNAHKYGFIISYPKENAYYTFEPWHWRFVGKDLADDLYDDGKYFYSLDQREIDTYLIKLFD